MEDPDGQCSVGVEECIFAEPRYDVRPRPACALMWAKLTARAMSMPTAEMTLKTVQTGWASQRVSKMK